MNYSSRTTVTCLKVRGRPLAGAGMLVPVVSDERRVGGAAGVSCECEVGASRSGRSSE